MGLRNWKIKNNKIPILMIKKDDYPVSYLKLDKRFLLTIIFTETNKKTIRDKRTKENVNEI